MIRLTSTQSPHRFNNTYGFPYTGSVFYPYTGVHFLWLQLLTISLGLKLLYGKLQKCLFISSRLHAILSSEVESCVSPGLTVLVGFPREAAPVGWLSL